MLVDQPHVLAGALCFEFGANDSQSWLSPAHPTVLGRGSMLRSLQLWVVSVERYGAPCQRIYRFASRTFTLRRLCSRSYLTGLLNSNTSFVELELNRRHSLTVAH